MGSKVTETIIKINIHQIKSQKFFRIFFQTLLMASTYCGTMEFLGW